MNVKEAKKLLHEELLDAVWENTAVSNCPRGEWSPEFFVPRNHEEQIDKDIDEAMSRFVKRVLDQ